MSHIGRAPAKAGGREELGPDTIEELRCLSECYRAGAYFDGQAITEISSRPRARKPKAGASEAARARASGDYYGDRTLEAMETYTQCYSQGSYFDGVRGREAKRAPRSEAEGKPSSNPRSDDLQGAAPNERMEKGSAGPSSTTRVVDSWSIPNDMPWRPREGADGTINAGTLACRTSVDPQSQRALGSTPAAFADLHD